MTVTKREATKIAKEIASEWLRTKASKAGTVATEVDRRFPDESLAEQIKIVDRVVEAIDELCGRLKPKETT